MSGGGIFWLVAATLAFWIGPAVLQTSLGRGDRKAWPIGWGATLVAWIVVDSPMLVVLPAAVLGFRWPIWAAILLGGTVQALAFRFGGKLPVVGRWVSVLQGRQEERARKGIL